MLHGRMRATRLLAPVDRLPTTTRCPKPQGLRTTAEWKTPARNTTEDYVDSIRGVPALPSPRTAPGAPQEVEDALVDRANRRCHAVRPWRRPAP
ncbi:unnamed protein product [Boreogadus saida]